MDRTKLGEPARRYPDRAFQPHPDTAPLALNRDMSSSIAVPSPASAGFQRPPPPSAEKEPYRMANDHACPNTSLATIIEIIRDLISHARANDLLEFPAASLRLCDAINSTKRSRFLSLNSIDGGQAVSTIVEHQPRKHPPTKSPREFDTLFIAALYLLELSGMKVTFQWLKDKSGRYYLRGEFSSAAGDRFYLARIVLNAEPSQRAEFNEDHHSYRRRELIQRAGGGTLPAGEYGRRAAIDRCVENYARSMIQYHETLSPDGLRCLLKELFIVADAFHSPKA